MKEQVGERCKNGRKGSGEGQGKGEGAGERGREVLAGERAQGKIGQVVDIEAVRGGQERMVRRRE